MGVTTDGEISFGFRFEEGYEFPWFDLSGDDDLDGWWREVNGYENPHFYPFDEAGNYKPGVTDDDPRVSEYFARQREWEKAHPISVEVVNYCSGDYPMYILAVPGTLRTANRGYAKSFDPASLVVTPEQVQALKDFCEKFKIETDGEPQWWLSSYWG